MASIRTTTAPTWPRLNRLADAGRIAGFILAVLLLEGLLARGVAGPEVARYVFLFLGLFVLAAVFRFPMATALVFFALIDFIFPSTMIAQSLGPLTIRGHEVLLGSLLVVAAVRPRRQTWGGTAGGALAAFLACAGLSAALAVLGGETSLSDAFNWIRPLGLLTFFYVVVRLFPEPEERRFLLVGAGALAAVTGVVALAIALGAGFGSALEGTDANTITSEGFGSIQRVRLAGLSLGYAISWYAVVQASALRGVPRVAWLAVVAGIGLNIAISFNRNMWLGLAIGAILMVILGGAMVRHRLAIASAVAVAGLAVLMVFGSASTSSQVVQPIIKRGATIITPSKTSKESSLKDRTRETEQAWRTARENLALGVGAGTPFGVNMSQPVDTGSFIIGSTSVPQLFLHNQYLYLLLIAGLPGLVAFLLFLGLPIAHALRRAPRDPAITSLAIGIGMVMISSVVAIYFTVDDMTAVLGLLAGVIVADSEGRAAEGESSGLVA